MSATTGIEWTDATWNPVVGCTKVTQGCKLCYAKTQHDRRHKAFLEGKKVAPQYAEPFEKVQLKPERLTAPLSWRVPKKIFVNSISDLFHDDVPEQFIAQMFAVMALADRHTFQALTKRPERMRALLSSAEFWDRVLDEAEDLYPLTRRDEGQGYEAWCQSILEDVEEGSTIVLPNLWLGVSVENQQAADERIPLLLQTPAAVRWLSCEPLLGPVYIPQYLPNPLWNDLASWKSPEINWVVVGGESGLGNQSPRPMHPDWALALRDQCLAANVPFFFKQWGDFSPVYDRDAEDPDWRRCSEVESATPRGQWLNLAGGMGFHGDRVVRVDRVGKKRAGRGLAGVTWDEFPRAEVGE